MIAAVILGAGKGSRLTGAPLPKQFMNLRQSPMIVETVEKFAFVEAIDRIVVVVSSPWMSHAKDLFEKKSYFKKMLFCQGGETRQRSLLNACYFLEREFGRDVCVVSHDAARPFVSLRIIEDNIKKLGEKKSCDTILSCTDTIVESVDGKEISNIPNRNLLYQGQTPQSFLSHDYIEAFEKIGEDSSVTDAAKLLLRYGKAVSIVEGEPFNIKITTDFDLAFANFLMSSK